MIVDAAEVKELVIGLLNGEPEEEGYEIYGMSINDNSVDAAIEMSRRNLLAIVGDSVFNDPAKENSVYSCLIDMSCYRVILNLMGLSIGSHFYYKTTDLTISKTALAPLVAAEEAYRISVRQWLKLIMGKGWTGVGIQDTLTIEDPVYSPTLGHDVITLDSRLYNNFL